MSNKIWRAIIALPLMLLVTARIVSAHAELVRALPAPNSVVTPAPSQVMLWFDEPIDLSFSSVQVFAGSGTRVDNGDLGVAPKDPKQLNISLKPPGNGTYTVVWKVLSAADGHVTSGNYAFSVGSATGAPASPLVTSSGGIDESSPISVAARALELWSILALVGTLFFRDFLLLPSLRAIDADDIGSRADARCSSLAIGATSLAVLSEVARLALQSSLVTGVISGAGIAGILVETRFGALWIARFLMLALMGLLLLRIPWWKKAVPSGALGKRENSLIVGALGIGILITLALNSHSSAQGELSLAVLADLLHLTAVAYWVGGLAAFLWVVVPVWQILPVEKRAAWLARLVPQFSLLALASVGVIVLTGLYSGILDVGSWSALLGTLYGEILTSKVALFILMLPFAAVNLFAMRGAFRAGESQESASHRMRLFRNLLASEVAIGIIVVALAGFLTLTPPARGVILAERTAPAAPHVFFVAHPALDVNVALTVSPPAGSNQGFDAFVTNANKQPAADVLRVIFEFTWLDQDAGSTRVNMDAAGDAATSGHYRTSGAYMSLPGMWRIQVIVRRKGQEDVSATFPFYQTVNATPALVNDPTALNLLKQSDAAMNKLSTLRSRQELNDGENGSVTTNLEYQAPNRLYFQVVGQGESIAVGGTQYYRDKGQETWTGRPRVDPFIFPSFDNATQAQGAKLGRAESLDGISTQIVESTTPSGNQQVHYAYWIGTQDLRVHQFLMVAPAHYMVHSYFDYDAPVNIQEPAVK